MTLDKDQAMQLAVMITVGMPSRDALRYFCPPEVDDREIDRVHDVTMRSKVVQAALVTVQGKPWQDMTLDEAIDYTLGKTYREMAYFLFANNYGELSGPDRAKADECRRTLEAKKAGNAGALSALEQFYADFKSGAVKLNKPLALPH